MKKTALFSAMVLLGFSGTAEIKLSNLTSMPGNMTVSQADIDPEKSVQTRNKSNDWRGISQSFRWDSKSPLDGIGIYISSKQDSWSKDQRYLLVIQELTAPKGTATSILVQEEFLMTADLVQPGTWLFLDMDNRNLNRKQWYGFTLCPMEEDTSEGELFWGVSTKIGAYEGAFSQFKPGASGMPKTDEYRSLGTDLAFYLKGAE